MLAGRTGFEPAQRFRPNGLANRPLKPNLSTFPLADGVGFEPTGLSPQLISSQRAYDQLAHPSILVESHRVELCVRAYKARPQNRRGHSP